MQNVLQVWSSLDLRRRIVVGAATAVMFVAILAMSRLASNPTMALLYSGLDPAAAGAVVAELEARGIRHEVRGEAILVPQSERDPLRLSLAAEGIPAQGGAGYELLESLDSFGTTTQMFDAAWGRAVEGELARTILANPLIRTARVHIARGQDRPFAPAAEPTASVFVTTAGGLSSQHAQALRHLVAAAVTGLRPDRVEVVDSVTGLVPISGNHGSGSGHEERAALIRQNVERMLEARVGTGRAVVEVSLDLVTQSEVLSERTVDPQSRVAVSTESTSSSGSETAGGGATTVASNLPDESADAGAESGQSRTQESRERVSYQVSETRRELTRQPGDIRRLSVAVIVDGQRIAGEDGTETWQPRPEEELAALRELVQAAAGIDEGRGDQLTIKSMELAPPLAIGTEAEAGWTFDATRVAGIGLLAAALLAVALFVLRPALRTSPVRAEPPLALASATETVPEGQVLTGEIQEDGDFPAFGRTIDSTAEAGSLSEDPVARLRRLIAERQDESVEILKSWMDAEEGRA